MHENLGAGYASLAATIQAAIECAIDCGDQATARELSAILDSLMGTISTLDGLAAKRTDLQDL